LDYIIPHLLTLSHIEKSLKYEGSDYPQKSYHKWTKTNELQEFALQ